MHNLLQTNPVTNWCSNKHCRTFQPKLKTKTSNYLLCCFFFSFFLKLIVDLNFDCKVCEAKNQLSEADYWSLWALQWIETWWRSRVLIPWWRRGRTRRDCGARVPRRFCRPCLDWPGGPSRQTGWTKPRGLWTSLQPRLQTDRQTERIWCTLLKKWIRNSLIAYLSHEWKPAGGLRGGHALKCFFCGVLLIWRTRTFHCCLGRVLIGSRWLVRLLTRRWRDGLGPIWNGGAGFRGFTIWCDAETQPLLMWTNVV